MHFSQMNHSFGPPLATFLRWNLSSYTLYNVLIFVCYLYDLTKHINTNKLK